MASCRVLGGSEIGSRHFSSMLSVSTKLASLRGLLTSCSSQNLNSLKALIRSVLGSTSLNVIAVHFYGESFGVEEISDVTAREYVGE